MCVKATAEDENWAHRPEELWASLSSQAALSSKGQTSSGRETWTQKLTYLTLQKGSFLFNKVRQQRIPSNIHPTKGSKKFGRRWRLLLMHSSSASSFSL